MDKNLLTQQKSLQPIPVRLSARQQSKEQQKQKALWLEIRLQGRLQRLLQRKHEDNRKLYNCANTTNKKYT